MSQSSDNAARRTSVFDHPLGFWFFFWGEFAERCCFYGMKAILILFMTQILLFDDGDASAVMSYYMAACYFMPLLGGYVADNYLGKYRTIVFFSVPYIIGQAILGVESLHSETALYYSLGLLAMGSGVIKPNISTLMGLTYDQQRPGNTKLRSDAFAMFYGAINIGAALSSFAVPAIANALGRDGRAYAIAFLFPTGLMILAFIVFALGKPFYAAETFERKKASPAERRERLTVLGRLFGLFAVIMVFWAIFDQSTITWTLFARDHLHLELFGLRLSPDQLATVNPILIVLLLPPITMFWHLLSRMGIDLRPTSKMLIGFILTGVTMAIVAVGGYRAERLAQSGAPAALEQAQHAVAAADDLAADRQAAPAVYAAARAAHLALDASRQALAVAEQNAHVPGTIQAIERAQEAAEELTSIVRKGQDARKKGEPAGSDDLAGASEAGNRAAAAVVSAKKSLEAANADNREAARVNAAVAVLASADAATLAARAAAKTRALDVPAIVHGAEAAAAAARVSIFWQVVPYLLITIAEICISVVGLELAFAAAPPTMKSFVTACWLSVVFLANLLINAQLTPFYNTVVLPDSLNVYMSPGLYFGLFAVAMVPVTLAFAIIARRFNRGVAR